MKRLKPEKLFSLLLALAMVLNLLPTAVSAEETSNLWGPFIKLTMDKPVAGAPITTTFQNIKDGYILDHLSVYCGSEKLIPGTDKYEAGKKYEINFTLTVPDPKNTNGPSFHPSATQYTTVNDYPVQASFSDWRSAYELPIYGDVDNPVKLNGQFDFTVPMDGWTEPVLSAPINRETPEINSPWMNLEIDIPKEGQTAMPSFKNLPKHCTESWSIIDMHSTGSADADFTEFHEGGLYWANFTITFDKAVLKKNFDPQATQYTTVNGIPVSTSFVDWRLNSSGHVRNPNEPTTMTGSFLFRIPNLTGVTSIIVNEIDTPVIGEIPDTTAAVAPGAKYTVAKVWWFNGDADVTGKPFAAESVYTVRVHVKPKEGQKLAPEAELSASVNGLGAEISRYYGENEGAVVSYTFPATAALPKEIIKSLAISDIDAPVTGETPDTTAVVPSDAEYTIANVWWFNGNTEVTGEPFAAESVYTVRVNVKPNEGRKLASETELSASVNGMDANIGRYYGENKGAVVSYTFPATAGESTEPTVITSVSATVTEPEAGKTPADMGAQTPDGITDYKIVSLSWYYYKNGTIIDLTDTDEFQSGTTYYAKVCFYTDLSKNKNFSLDTTGIINGGSCTCSGISTDGQNVYFDIEFTIPEASHTHTGILVAGQKPTHAADGWKDYYKCSCGKFFEDAACTNEITDLDAWKNGAGKLDKLVYTVIEGNNSSWQKNSDKTITFKANGDFAEFTGIKIDGTLAAPEQYTAKSGSTIVTLKQAYLQSLSEGPHTITFLYTDGQCEANFTIKAAEAPVETVTITYDANGGIKGSDFCETQSVTSGTDITWTAPTDDFLKAPEGKQYKGVEIDGVFYPKDSTYTVTKDVTVKLIWEDKENPDHPVDPTPDTPDKPDKPDSEKPSKPDSEKPSKPDSEKPANPGTHDNVPNTGSSSHTVLWLITSIASAFTLIGVVLCRRKWNDVG